VTSAKSAQYSDRHAICLCYLYNSWQDFDWQRAQHGYLSDSRASHSMVLSAMAEPVVLVFILAIEAAQKGKSYRQTSTHKDGDWEERESNSGFTGAIVHFVESHIPWVDQQTETYKPHERPQSYTCTQLLLSANWRFLPQIFRFLATTNLQP